MCDSIDGCVMWLCDGCVMWVMTSAGCEGTLQNEGEIWRGSSNSTTDMSSL